MSEQHYIRGTVMGPQRRRGWVRPGLTVHLAKYDRMAAIGDVGCYHVLRADGLTLCGRNARRPHWRDAGWGDSEVVCCKLCARILWPRWLRDGACDGVDQRAEHTIAAEDRWPSPPSTPSAAPPAAPRVPGGGRMPAPIPAAGQCGG